MNLVLINIEISVKFALMATMHIKVNIALFYQPKASGYLRTALNDCSYASLKMENWNETFTLHL